MSRIGTITLAAIAALTLTIAQPRPAEAGSGGFIAGLAIGVATAAIIHHHRHYCRWGGCRHRYHRW